ncbi:hypothetical protein [Alicyclobacillus sp.]|uniref:hypothetical protein n=1 Tax=Alicyclobacillus sp. TaxID=61169 RepID=UPI0025C249F9|nr:hypothetical protein [Alicyclobacillus sp.]MCL6517949.1 hypothetical protein [Alicyclobacillus sp.]
MWVGLANPGAEWKTFSTVQEALQHLNELVREAQASGWNWLTADVGEHINPGDVYDAYEALGLGPTAEDVLDAERCGPIAAVVLTRFQPADRALWRTLAEQRFDAQYLEGFRAGFRLTLPATSSAFRGRDALLRGVYDGVMANAAVF